MASKNLTVGHRITLLAAIQILALTAFVCIFVWNKWAEVEVARTMRVNAGMPQIDTNAAWRVPE